MAADMNLTPSNDGNIVRINIPALNSETRAQFAKQALAVAEDGKVRQFFLGIYLDYFLFFCL
jgi:ribosome recycling factor